LQTKRREKTVTVLYIIWNVRVSCHRLSRNVRSWPLFLNQIQPYNNPNIEEIHGLLKKNCKDTTGAMTRHCRLPCITGYRERTATFMRLENMLLFRGAIRLLTNMETILKKNCTFSNVAVKAL